MSVVSNPVHELYTQYDHYFLKELEKQYPRLMNEPYLGNILEAEITDIMQTALIDCKVFCLNQNKEGFWKKHNAMLLVYAKEHLLTKCGIDFDKKGDMDMGELLDALDDVDIKIVAPAMKAGEKSPSTAKK